MKKSGRRLRLAALKVPNVPDLVETVFARMRQGHPATRRPLRKLRSWFLTKVRERDYPTRPWGGTKEMARRQKQLPGWERLAA